MGGKTLVIPRRGWVEKEVLRQFVGQGSKYRCLVFAWWIAKSGAKSCQVIRIRAIKMKAWGYRSRKWTFEWREYI